MKSLVGFTTLILMLCAAAVFAQTEIQSEATYPALNEVSYNYHGGSARAMGMGYAFVGLSNDVSSGVWNPAGLWILEGPMISASYNQYKPSGDYFQSISGLTAENDLGLSGIGHFSFVAPVRIKGHPWVFTFNYNRNNEYSEEFSYKQILDSELDRDSYVEDKGYMRTFNVGASTRIYKQLSMGFTLNVIDARRVIDNKFFYITDVVIDPTYGITGEWFMARRLIDSTTSNGFNFTLGLMWKQDKYSIGAAVRTPYTITHTTDRSDFETTTLNDLLQVDYTSTTYVVDSIAKQEIPMSLTFGVGLFPMENLTIAMDFVFQQYGSTNWFYRTSSFFEPNGERNDFFDEFPIDWNNTFGFGLGAEYYFSTGIGRIPVRSGFRYDQLPPPSDMTILTSNVEFDCPCCQSNPREVPLTITRTADNRQNTTSFSIGTGIAWAQIELDFAYMYTSGFNLELAEKVILYEEDNEGNPGFNQIESINEWKQNSHEVRFTFTGYF